LPLHRWELPLIIGILGLGLYLRVLDLGTIPYTLNGDEAAQGLESVKVLRGEIRDPFTTGWRGVPALNFYFTSLFVKAMGPTVVALRLPWALVGFATIPAAYALVRTLTDQPTALVTAALLATYHYHIHFSRLGSNQIADPLLASLALLFLFRALRTTRHLDWALVGIVSGMALYLYVGARLVPMLVVVIFMAETVRGGRPALRRHLPGLAFAMVGFVISAGPILQYAIRFPELYNVRVDERGILQSGWLVREIGTRGETAWTIVYDQFRRSALAFNYYPDRTTFYGLTHPLLDPFFGALFMVGVIATWIRGLTSKRDGNLLYFAIWWLGATTLGGMLIDSPPSSQQLVTLAVPVCLLVAWTLRALSQFGRLVVPRLREGILLGCAVGLFAALSLRTYFHEFTPQRLSGGPYAELATAVAPELERLGAGYAVYLLGAPRMYADFPTLTYLAPSVEIRDLPVELTVALLANLAACGQGLAFVMIPQRTEDLAVLQEALPGGRAQSLLRPSDRRVIATLYIIPPMEEPVQCPKLPAG
jgi:4-amino-4-deoxy-L-arabinose transferase-like glycosyltransferase